MNYFSRRLIFIVAVRPSDRQTVRPSDRQTVRPSDRQTVRPSDRQTVKPSDRQTVRPSDRQTVRPSDRQTVRPSDRQSVPSDRRRQTVTVRASPSDRHRQTVTVRPSPSPRRVASRHVASRHAKRPSGCCCICWFRVAVVVCFVFVASCVFPGACYRILAGGFYCMPSRGGGFCWFCDGPYLQAA